MSYIFPRRVLRPGDVLDPQELTEDITPAADRVSGKLNMHNFDQGVASTIVVDGEAYYTVHHYKKIAPFFWTRYVVSPPLSTPPWGEPDGAEQPASALAQNNFEWQAVIDSTGEPTEVALTTGQSVLWVNAFVQYVWWGFNPALGSGSWFGPYRQHINEAQDHPANIQFALRVNGNIIAETITGIDDLTYRVSIPFKPFNTRSDGFTDGLGDGLLPRPQDIFGPQLCALGPPCLPVRIGACVPCVPGDQRVELVMRRVPLILSGNVASYSRFDKIYVYARQINVVELKSFPIDSVGPAEATAPALETEDTLNQAALYTNRVQPIIAAYNDVQEGSLARGALMHYHLPSALFAAATTERAYTGGVTFNNYYPGWLGAPANTVTTTGYSGAQAFGWKIISDASNNNQLRVDNINISSTRKLLILANVFVRNVGGSVEVTQGGGTVTISVGGGFNITRTSNNEPLRVSAFSQFALFQLMWQPVGAGATTWTSLQESVGMVNNFVWWPKVVESGDDRTPVPAEGQENVDVPLMALMEITIPSATPINIGVFGSVANTDSTYEFVFGNLIVLSMRA
jgi:hypothetical protein